MNNPKKKILLICSSGGHLFQLFSLKDFWYAYEREWVSFPTSDAKHLLKSEEVVWAYYPTNRSLVNVIKNLFLAWKVVGAYKPDAIISTGAGVGVPFIFVAWFLGIQTIYLESITRSRELSLSARLIYPFVSRLLVQWPEVAEKFPKAEYHGQVI